MKSKMIMAAGLAATLTASVPAWGFTFDDIRYWVGDGTNRVGFVVDWDGAARAWGYRWSGDAPSVGTIIRATAARDARLAMESSESQYGLYMQRFSYDADGNGMQDEGEPDRLEYSVYNPDSPYAAWGEEYAYDYYSWNLLVGPKSDAYSPGNPAWASTGADSLIAEPGTWYMTAFGLFGDVTLSDPLAASGEARFSSAEVEVSEGEAAIVRVSGGLDDTESSVMLYLAYRTAAAADLDLAKGTVDGVAPKGGLKFPLTLTWAAGEKGEKEISIPVKADKTLEVDETFVLQLADAHGMGGIGDVSLCTVAVKDPGLAELAGKIESGTATAAESKAWDKLQSASDVPYVCGLADTADRGKVTGSGSCAANKKVTLRATPNKGFVFMGWRDSMDAAGYVATTPNLVIDRTARPAKDTATSTTITDVTGDATFYAHFITVEDDRSAISLAVDGWNVEDGASATNVMCGVALQWPIAVAARSATTVKVAGLPAGLKFADKPVTGKVGTGNAATVVTNVPANTIYGTPTAASKVDSTTGLPKPSAVKVTVTTAGKTTATYLISLTVDPLPAWAVGTFDGYVLGRGIATMSVTAAGKASGKIALDGTNWTFKADSFAITSETVGETNLAIETTATAGKTTRALSLGLARFPTSYIPDSATGRADGLLDASDITLYRIPWADKGDTAPAKHVAQYAGAYSCGVAYGDETGVATFTVDGKGVAKGSLALPGGAKTRKAAFSANVLPYAGSVYVAIYAAPDAKKEYPAVFETRQLVASSGPESDKIAYRDPGVVVTVAELNAESGASGLVTMNPKYGQVAMGKDVTLTAKAEKGSVFSCWVVPPAYAENVDIYAPTLKLKMGGEGDIPVTAYFVTAEEDKAKIGLVVNKMSLFGKSSGEVNVPVTLECGIAVDWPIAATSLSKATVKVSGLPAGLKLVQDKATGAYSVTGVPTAASKTNKDGTTIPSTVTFTVTTAGKSVETFVLGIVVNPLPDWVVGTFYGFGDVDGTDANEDDDPNWPQPDDKWEWPNGLEVKVSPSGAVAAKVVDADGRANTFKATGLYRDGDDYCFEAAFEKGKEHSGVVCRISARQINSDGSVFVGVLEGLEEGVDEDGDQISAEWFAYQDVFAAKPAGVVLPTFDKNDKVLALEVDDAESTRLGKMLDTVSGTLSMSFGATGSVTPAWRGETSYKMVTAHLTPYASNGDGSMTAMLWVMGHNTGEDVAVGFAVKLNLPCDAAGVVKASEIELELLRTVVGE